MLKLPCQEKKQKQRLFQSMFLSNGKTKEVTIFEDDFIDFGEVQKHLDNGGSVFITSKNSQKLQFDQREDCKSRKLKKKEHD